MIKSGFYSRSLLFIAFFLPLVFGTPTNELYEFPKMYFIYFFGGLLVFFFAVKKVLRQEKWPVIPVTIKLYLLSFVVSTAFSVHVYTSLWGYYTRFNDCLISTLVFFGIYVVAKSKLARSDIDQILKVSLFSILPISFLAISQHQDLTRVYSTFGQPNWLAQYLAILLPFANFLYFSGGLVWLWFGISVLGFAGLWFTYSMSGILGYGVAFAFLLFFFRRSVLAKGINRYRFLFLILIYEVIVFTNLGVFKLRVLDVVNDAKNLITVVPTAYAQTQDDSLATARNLSDPGFIRGGLWKGSFELFLSSPKTFLIGTGPETFPYAFQKFRPKILNYSSEWNFVFNKPHNYFLEVVTEQGLFGLLIYLYLYLEIFKRLEKKYLPSFIAFAVTNIFGWPTVATTFLFWLFLASTEVSDEKIY